jgi:hypothetical protein
VEIAPELVLHTDDATRLALDPFVGADWTVPARDLEWSCRTTGVHLADDYFAYASQILAEPPTSYLPVEVTLVGEATPAGLLDTISMCARLLHAAATVAPASSRGWHPAGTSDPGGFVAMGVVEGLVHTYDIAAAFGVEWRPPAELCAPVLQRLFPDAPAGDPARVLLWSAGRVALDDRPRLEAWTWDSSVRD